jgi:hypothetical protein
MSTPNRNDLRTIVFDAWHKHLNQLLIEPLEKQIIDIILEHPHYHVFLSQREQFMDYDFEGDNPFLHISLHIALRDQISTNRPAGIRELYQTLRLKYGETLRAEHAMLPCLEKILWEAQAQHTAPNEERYLEALRQLT